MYLFFDTETTGFVSQTKALNDPDQPHMVQLGAILTDAEGHTMGEMNVLINNDVDIPEQASNIHGITRELCSRYGITLEGAAQMFSSLGMKATHFIAHNFAYDHQILNIVKARLAVDTDYVRWNPPSFCTMQACTNICKLPKARGAGYKWPKLQEAYKFFFDSEFTDAHDAMADVRACKDVFFALKSRGFPTP